MRAYWASLPALLLLACYESPGVTSGSDVIDVRVEPSTADADGFTKLTVTAVIDGKTDETAAVTFTTSGGTFPFASEDSPATVQRVGARVAADDSDENEDSEHRHKEISTTLVVGRTSGTLFVSGSLGAFVDEVSVTLEPAKPESVVASSSVSALRLNGTDRAAVSLDLFRDSGSVSFGARIAAQVCCSDADENVVECPGREPVRVPGGVELTAGSTIETEVIAESLTPDEFEKLESPVAYVLFGPSSPTTLSCSTPPDASDLLRFALSPP